MKPTNKMSQLFIKCLTTCSVLCMISIVIPTTTFAAEPEVTASSVTEAQSNIDISSNVTLDPEDEMLPPEMVEMSTPEDAPKYEPPKHLSAEDILQLFRLPEEVTYTFLSMTSYPETEPKIKMLMTLLQTRHNAKYEAPDSLMVYQTVLNIHNDLQHAFHLLDLHIRAINHATLQMQLAKFEPIEDANGLHFNGTLKLVKTPIPLSQINSKAVFQIVEKGNQPDSLELALFKQYITKDNSNIIISALPADIQAADKEELVNGIEVAIQLPDEFFETQLIKKEEFTDKFELYYLGQEEVEVSEFSRLKQLTGRAVELFDTERNKVFNLTCALSERVALVSRVQRWLIVKQMINTYLLENAKIIQEEKRLEAEKKDVELKEDSNRDTNTASEVEETETDDSSSVDNTRTTAK